MNQGCLTNLLQVLILGSSLQIVCSRSIQLSLVSRLSLGEDIMERKRPFPVGGALAGKNVVQVVCGGMHTVALTDEGEVGVAALIIPGRPHSQVIPASFPNSCFYHLQYEKLVDNINMFSG